MGKEKRRRRKSKEKQRVGKILEREEMKEEK